jgi:hypothetical protein
VAHTLRLSRTHGSELDRTPGVAHLTLRSLPERMPHRQLATDPATAYYPPGVVHMPTVQPPQPRVRLADVVASLSLATDLATGQPLEHGLRRALLALWLGDDLGLNSTELSDVYYVALLGTVGCTIEGSAFAEFFKDDIAFAERVATVDPTRPLSVAAFVLSQAGAGEPPIERARKLLAVARAGPTANQVVCRDVALQLGAMLDLGPAITEAVAQCHEHWDGSGGPRRLRGEQLKMAARLFLLAHHADIFHRLGGMDAAVAVARQRSGKVLRPAHRRAILRRGQPISRPTSSGVDLGNVAGG